MRRTSHLAIAVTLVLLTIWLVACGPTPTPTVFPQTGGATDIIKASVAQQLSLSVDAIQFKDLNPVDWSDTCLRAPAADDKG